MSTRAMAIYWRALRRSDRENTVWYSLTKTVSSIRKSLLLPHRSKGKTQLPKIKATNLELTQVQIQAQTMTVAVISSWGNRRRMIEIQSLLCKKVEQRSCFGAMLKVPCYLLLKINQDRWNSWYPKINNLFVLLIELQLLMQLIVILRSYIWKRKRSTTTIVRCTRVSKRG